MKRFLTFLAVLALAAAPLVAAETFAIDRAHSEATFQVRHLMSKVSGRFDKFDGAIQIDRANPAASTVEFNIDAASINTSMEGRDKHLRSADFFEVEKYPSITFKSTKVAKTKEKDLYNVTGQFTMRGVTREVTLPVRFLGFMKDPWGNERAGFEVEAKLNRKDYGINWNKALDAGGFVLSDEVKVSIALESVVKKEAVQK